MTYRREVFIKQLPLVDCFVRHLVHHRAIKSRIGRYRLRSPLWGDTADAHLLQATIYWCMVFGSYGCNRTHWRHLAVSEAEQLQKSFRAGLYAALGVSETEWKSYWEDLLAFRDKYVAHRELTFSQPVPVFDRALEAAFYYDGWIRAVIAPDVLDEAPLRKLAAELEEKVGAEVAVALEATAADRQDG